MRFITFIFLALLISCNSNPVNDKKLELFNNTSFSLEPGEIVIPITPEIKDTYTRLVKQSDKIPLFRYIKGSDYEIFIGIPYGTNLKELIYLQKQSSDSLKSDSLTYFYNVNNDNDTTITNYVTNSKDNLISITVLAIHAPDSLFSIDKLKTRVTFE